ncbi:ABC transporter [Bacillus sp. UMB0899]|uniref:ATP-binding cassette domain-containing protein n=1 Tax=Metabacillus schmidteae TaxID=2730405 RepID=UPI000C7FBD63|nr:ABC transporter ATP-binding protein [Metabacillus schmidteae]PMC40314.1 ABC transporter [Bacillus sp. UMB0899]
MSVIECKGLSKNYGKKRALHQVSFVIKENTITGLIGRNGAGKTTLLKLIAGFFYQTEGDLKVFSKNPFNSLFVSANRIYIDDQLNFPNTLTLKDILQSAASFYMNWDHTLADKLFDYFTFHPSQRYQQLSKGMKSTFNMIIGLSSRCSLTIFDEPTTGMDASVRKDFYRALLKDYLDHPRTIILSSHLLNEIEDLLEDILLLKDGEKCLHVSIEELKEYGVYLQGSNKSVREIAGNKEVFYEKSLGHDHLQLGIENTLTNLEMEEAASMGVHISPISADDLCTYLTNKTIGGIDDVFNRS